MTTWDDEEPELGDDDVRPDDERTGDGDLRAPICGFCGVTALPEGTSNLVETVFVCDNEGCEAYREPVA